MLKSYLCVRGSLVQDNGHSLVPVPKRSGFFYERGQSTRNLGPHRAKNVAWICRKHMSNFPCNNPIVQRWTQKQRTWKIVDSLFRRSGTNWNCFSHYYFCKSALDVVMGQSKSAVFMGKNYSDIWHSIKNTKDLTVKQMFDISTRLVSEQDGISGLETIIGWENHSWVFDWWWKSHQSSAHKRSTSFRILCCVLVRYTRTLNRTMHGYKDWDG